MSESSPNYAERIVAELAEYEQYARMAAMYLTDVTAVPDEADPDQEVVTEQQRDRFAAIGAAYAQLATAKALSAQAIAAHRANQIAGR